MKILILSPHTDDAEIGCGASIAKFIEQGEQVRVITFTDCSDELKSYDDDILRQEFTKSMGFLGVKDFILLNFKARFIESRIHEIRQIIYDQFDDFKPDILYIPSLTSRHEDHLTVAIAGNQVAGRRDVKVLGYYLVGDNISFKPTYFEVIEETHMSKKLTALRCYSSQYDLRSFFSDANFEATLRFYSTMTGNELVEPFEVIKWVQK